MWERERLIVIKIEHHNKNIQSLYTFLGWADRVYYSDNGSTAVEIAIKMAFRKYLHDKNLLAICNSEKESHNLKVQL